LSYGQGNPVKINKNLIGLSYGQGNPVKINKNLIGLSYGQGNPVKINKNHPMRFSFIFTGFPCIYDNPMRPSLKIFQFAQTRPMTFGYG
jgi:hypothetical protein